MITSIQPFIQYFLRLGKLAKFNMLPLIHKNIPRGRVYLVLLSLALIAIVLVFRSLQTTDHAKLLPLAAMSNISPRDLAANGTLGFHKILALSTGPSWRTRGLDAAAQLTGLQITIPPQPRNPPELISAFASIGKEQGATLPRLGSATAWMAHLDLLKYVVASELTTAFIVEDDVDWDVRIKEQTKLISDNVRLHTGTSAEDTTPYGTEWDVLWLGHCGSLIADGMPEPRSYGDYSRCETALYSGWSKQFLREKLAENHRLVQTSIQTVCTFGYGVTKSSAQKVLSLVGTGADEAFDVSLSAHCRAGELRCLVVNPQVFNHYEPPAGHGYLSHVHVGDGQGNAASEKAEAEFEREMGTTGNIMKSARCEALFHKTCMRPPSEI
ncbi:glycosyltransferase family 25 protein [Xylaria bambusicola]|uniref:glycosyltransferase family 25 protein n=1 Tax=Xylaria bambusicola TaxID=326684 RepID=UPI002008A971|nr:glycosyltransferase family 25 protein [Xylaria bambusicola]KAI0527827.1 glycosyltransferase family 25 protein [Xylaria bambusicola]